VRGQLARVGDEVRHAAPELPLVAGPYVPPRSVQAAVKATRAAQVLALGAYVLGESLFASSPRLLALLAAAHANRFPLGLGAYLTHVACEMAYSTSAFEVYLNGHVVFSKMREGRFPAPGEVARRLREVAHADAKRRALDSQGLVVVEAGEGADDAPPDG